MQAFSQGQHEFLGSLLNVVIVKLRYDDETEWDADEDEPEEEALFFEMRKVYIYDIEKKNILLTKMIEFTHLCRAHCHD
jgi:hypothetical protein